jgi:hypothetical protein
MVRMDTLINPVNRFAARKTARPFLLIASSSGGTALPPDENRLISMTRYPNRKVVLYAATHRTYGRFAYQLARH